MNDAETQFPIFCNNQPCEMVIYVLFMNTLNNETQPRV